MGSINESAELERVVRLLREAIGRMAEAYALLQQSGPRAGSLRWDDRLAWQIEELQKAVNTCATLERRLNATGAGR